MTLYTTIIMLLFITLAALAINLPFGYLRGGVKKLSFMWFFYIHAPIPAIFIMRRLAGFSIKYVPIFIVGAIIGQVIGRRFYTRRQPEIINE